MLAVCMHGEGESLFYLNSNQYDYQHFKVGCIELHMVLNRLNLKIEIERGVQI